MKTLEVPVAEAKKRFSETVNQAAFSPCRIIITKRSRPVAALVNMNDLRQLEQQEKRGGLASIVNRWSHFEEIETAVTQAFKSRQKEKVGRHVSF